MSELAAAAISRLVDEFGASLIDNPDKLKSLLMDEVPEARSEISILLRALEDKVPQDLLRAHRQEPTQSHVSRLVSKLQQRGYAADASKSAVETWAQALHISDGPIDPANDIDHEDHAPNGPDTPAHGPEFVPRRPDDITLDPSRIARDDTPKNPDAPLRDESGAPRPTPTSVSTQRNKFGWLGIVAVLVALAGGGFYYKNSLPEVKINSVEAPGGFAGDGKPHQLTMDFKSRNATPKSVLVTYLGGDLTGFPKEATVPVPQSAAQSGHIDLGSYAYRTTAPAQGKFEYVLQTADGKSSEPYQQTITVTPVPAELPKIVNISMSNKLVAGQAVTLTIAYADAEFGVTKLERKVIQSTTNWDPLRTLDFDMADKSSGALTYDISKDVPANTSTFEFTVIDSRGNRSAPQRVTFTVEPAPKQVVATSRAPVSPAVPAANARHAYAAPPVGVPCQCGTVVAVQEVRVPAAQGSGIGAVAGAGAGALAGNQIGRGTGRTLSTIGGALLGAFGGNAVEKRVNGQTAYDITIQMDSGARQVVRQASPPSVARGMRAKIVAGMVQPA